MAEARDYVYITLAVVGVFGALFAFTGNWPPVFVVESNSMMHVNETQFRNGEGSTRAEDVGFGRMGTIDPGDLILVSEVDGIRDVETFAEGGEEHYGAPGEVIAFRRTGEGSDLSIVHRAMTYVNVTGEGSDRNYTVQWTDAWDEPPEEISTCQREPEYICTFNDRGVFLPELGVFQCASGPPQTGGLGQPSCPDPQPKPFLGPGLITKGDNAVTNPGADQAPAGRGQTALNPQPVAEQQIIGTAEGELPGLGLLKVAFSGNKIHNADIREHPYFLRIGNMVAPVDLWAIALAEVGAIAASPVAVTIGRELWEGRREDRVPELSALRDAAQRRSRE